MGVHLRVCVLSLSSIGLYDALSQRCRGIPPSAVSAAMGTEKGSSENNRDISSRWLLIRRDNARGPSATVCYRRKALASVRARARMCADVVCAVGISRPCAREKARAFICLLAGPGINNAAIRYKNEKKGW